MKAQRYRYECPEIYVVGSTARKMTTKKNPQLHRVQNPNRRKKMTKTMHQRWVANIFMTLGMVVLYSTGFVIGLCAIITALLGNTLAAVGMFPYCCLMLLGGIISGRCIKK